MHWGNPLKDFPDYHIQKGSFGVRITLTHLVQLDSHQGSTHKELADVSFQVLTFRIGNHPGVLNPSPSVEKVQVRFICAHPASMLVTPMYKAPSGTQPCPLPQYNKQLVSTDCVPNTHDTIVSYDQGPGDLC